MCIMEYTNVCIKYIALVQKITQIADSLLILQNRLCSEDDVLCR